MQIDHESHAAKPVRAQYKAIKERRSRAELKKAKADEARIEAAAEYEAAKAKVLAADERCRDETRKLDAVVVEQEKLASIVEAMDAENPVVGGASVSADVDADVYSLPADEFSKRIEQARTDLRVFEAIEQRRLACAAAPPEAYSIGTLSGGRLASARPRLGGRTWTW